jgi:dihydroorotate dehydrogenase electron transfer subunit
VRKKSNEVDRDVVVTFKEEFLPGVFRMCLETGEVFCANSKPGQFIQIEVSPGPFPVTRRPFTISRTYSSSIEIIFEIVGRGTALLSEVETGSAVRVLGPLGSGYELNNGGWLLVGGGLGAAGFPGLVSEIDCRLMLLGASSKDRLLPVPGVSLLSITEDGSSGRKGLVTDLLESVPWDSVSNIAVCGPVAMMKAVIHKIPVEFISSTQISAEARMGCGWGACEGCSIPKAGGGYLKCCSDGPVFPADSIDWERYGVVS